jgi:hypothetical protein
MKKIARFLAVLALIIFAAVLHVGPIVPILLIAGGFAPLTETSVSILMLIMVVNTIGLVQLHVWNAKA